MSSAETARDLTDAELERVAGQFRMLGEPMRLKILQALCVKPLTVGEIVAATGATQSNISKHLSLLAIVGGHYAPKGRPVCLLPNEQSADVEALRTSA